MEAAEVAKALSGRTFTDGERAAWDEAVKAMYECANDLIYPTDQYGNVIALHHTGLTPVIAFHLVMRGWRPDRSKAQRKPRKVSDAEGIVSDAVEWVPVSEPDEEVATEDMTLADMQRLSPAAQARVIRKLGGTPPERPDSGGWSVAPNITFEGFDE